MLPCLKRYVKSIFLSKSFKDLLFIYKALIHLEFIFVYDMSQGSSPLPQYG